MLSTVLGFFLKVESSFHFCNGGHRIFRGVGVIMNLKRLDVLFDNKLSIIRLYLFCFVSLFLLSFCLRAKMTNTSSNIVPLDPSILLGKKSAESRSKCL